MGAEIVIAVNLIGDSAYRGALIADPVAGEPRSLPPHGAERGRAHRRGAGGAQRGARLRRQFAPGANGAPGIATALLEAFNITQDRIARSRLAGDPPDVLINARLAKIGFFEFHRADELIALGREAARRALDDIAEMAALERKLHEPA